MPSTLTSLAGVYMAGDWLAQGPGTHGAKGLSQEKAYVTGLQAGNQVRHVSVCITSSFARYFVSQSKVKTHHAWYWLANLCNIMYHQVHVRGNSDSACLHGIKNDLRVIRLAFTMINPMYKTPHPITCPGKHVDAFTALSVQDELTPVCGAGSANFGVQATSACDPS